jgi:hypothetical protein
MLAVIPGVPKKVTNGFSIVFRLYPRKIIRFQGLIVGNFLEKFLFPKKIHSPEKERLALVPHSFQASIKSQVIMLP